MLKHTSTNASSSGSGNASAVAVAANGQLRTGSSNTPNLTPTSPATSTGAATCNTNATTTTTTTRSIHLRPQQPLNVSTLNTSILNASTASVGTLNGGARIPNGGSTTAASSPPMTLLNIAAPPPPSSSLGINNIYTNQSTLLSNQQHHHQHHQQHQPQQTTAPPAAATHNQQNNYSNCNNLTGMIINQSKHGPGPREALTSLGLLCLVSLLFALLSLIFLLKISPSSRDDIQSRNVASSSSSSSSSSFLPSANSEDFIIVYDVTLALCALSLSLNLCCLLVCAIQFLFAVKLVRSPMFDGRDNKYLEKSSASRTCAVGGFFISIPIFLTGIILYTFNHFQSTPAIITSVLIGIGIVFCGGAMVHNVFIWQKEKTISYRSPPQFNMSLNMSMPPQSPTLLPPQPPILLNALYHQTHATHSMLHPHNNLNSSYHINMHPTSVTPVSPNHSHGSFNPLVIGGCNASAPIGSSSFLMRPSTATPPTPKPIANGACLTAREASGSVSPGIPPTLLDMSNIMSNSLHELSTLV